MLRAIGGWSLFSSPLRPHEVKEDLEHTAKRKGSSRDGGFFSHQKIIQSLFHTVTAAD